MHTSNGDPNGTVPPTPLFGELLPERRSGVIRVHTRALALV